MKKFTFIIGLCLCFANSLRAQNELEIVRLAYDYINSAMIENERFPLLNQISVNTRTLELMMRYGHDLGKNGWGISYEISYQSFLQTLELPETLQDSSLQSIPINYYWTPAFSQIAFTSGITKSFKNNWTGFTGVTLSLTDDLFSDRLSGNLTWTTTTYVEKVKNERFSYGFGAFINQLENRLLISPILNLNIQNSKRGIALLFPQKLSLWQTVGRKSYLETMANFTSFSLKYNPESEIASTNILQVKAGILYHYVWEEFLKFSFGINIPIGFYTVHSQNDSIHYTLGNNLGLNLSLSLVIPND